MSSSSSAYLFLEIATAAFFLGFCWEHATLRLVLSRSFWTPALILASLWFVIDQIALRIGLWTFPAGGTVPIRIASLPLEEYLLFFLHTLLCLLILRLARRAQQR